jgi:hypothetical protein
MDVAVGEVTQADLARTAPAGSLMNGLLITGQNVTVRTAELGLQAFVNCRQCGGSKVRHTYRPGRARTFEPKPHEQAVIASVPLDPKFAKRWQHGFANFGFGTSAQMEPQGRFQVSAFALAAPKLSKMSRCPRCLP